MFCTSGRYGHQLCLYIAATYSAWYGDDDGGWAGQPVAARCGIPEDCQPVTTPRRLDEQPQTADGAWAVWYGHLAGLADISANRQSCNAGDVCDAVRSVCLSVFPTAYICCAIQPTCCLFCDCCYCCANCDHT